MFSQLSVCLRGEGKVSLVTCPLCGVGMSRGVGMSEGGYVQELSMSRRGGYLPTPDMGPGYTTGYSHHQILPIRNISIISTNHLNSSKVFCTKI